MDSETLEDPLLATEQLLETLLSPEYWEKVCPHLHATGRTPCKTSVTPSAETVGDFKERLACDGFFRWTDAVEKETVDALRRGVECLLAHNWPPTFIFMFDEAWNVVERLSGALKASSGGSMFLGDVYAWSVNPAEGARGWGPHRDRMGTGPASFRSDDRTPMLTTSWLALSDASPSNSCLHVVPAYADPFYHAGDDPTVDPLKTIFSGPDAYQDIRALPCSPGSLVHFSHRIIHWGSAARTSAPPRVAMSWIIGDEAFEEPAFPRTHLPQPPLALRAGFVSGQLLSYGGQVRLKGAMRSICTRLFRGQRNVLTPWYVDKVEYLVICRPPPKNVQLRKRRNGEDENKPMVRATEEDDKPLDGFKGLFFHEDDSSSSEED